MSQTNITSKMAFDQCGSQGMGRAYDVNAEIEELAKIRNSKVAHIGQIYQAGCSEWANGQSKDLKSIKGPVSCISLLVQHPRTCYAALKPSSKASHR